MEWVVLVNGEEKAMFKEELDAMEYRDFLKNLYRMGGYKEKVEVRKASHSKRIDGFWTMLEQKETKKWELVFDDVANERIIPTGYMSSDMNVMLKFVGYMNYGVKSDLPQVIIDDLDFIKKEKSE